MGCRLLRRVRRALVWYAMIRPVRIQLSRRKGFKMQTLSRKFNGLDAVKVSRPGRWGNPFVVSTRLKPGTRIGAEYTAVPSIEEAVETFRELYPVHVMTRKSFGLMMRKLSVTESQKVRPIPRNLFTQKTERRIGELGASCVALVVSDVSVHEAP